MPWIAGCRIEVGRGEIREKGDPVPEAEDWKSREAEEALGRIRWVPEQPRQVVLPVPPASPPKEEPVEAKAEDEERPKPRRRKKKKKFEDE